MIREFQLEIPLPVEKTFKLLERSASGINSWKLNQADAEHYYLEWKQSFWALSGSASIIAVCEGRDRQRTGVRINVCKPIQVFDPFGICERIFKKLERALNEQLPAFQQEADHG